MLGDILNTNRLTLRLPRVSEAAQIFAGISDPKVNRWLVRVPKPYRLEHAREWIRGNPTNIKNDIARPFSIVLKETDKIIGGISLNSINRKDRSAELGYWIARDHWGNGYALEAAREICRYGFSRGLNLHRIYAWVHSENPASYRVLEKLGFRREAVCVKASNATGRWKDDYLYALLKGELIR